MSNEGDHGQDPTTVKVDDDDVGEIDWDKFGEDASDAEGEGDEGDDDEDDERIQQLALALSKLGSSGMPNSSAFGRRSGIQTSIIITNPGGRRSGLVSPNLMSPTSNGSSPATSPLSAGGRRSGVISGLSGAPGGPGGPGGSPGGPGTGSISIARKAPASTARRSALSPTDQIPDLVPDSEKEKREKSEANRQRVRSEINSTEQTYVESLFKCLNIFLKPLKEKPGDYDLQPQQVALIFANIEAIAAFHQTFLKELATTGSAAQVIIKYADFLKMYATYLNGYNIALQALNGQRTNKKFQKFLEVQRKVCGMDITSYLIMPVQRIPRYELLLRELLRYTDKEDPEYEKLTEASEKIKAVAQFVNDAKPVDVSKLFAIQNRIIGDFNLVDASRVFVREGPLMKKTAGVLSKSHIRIFYLFNDLLMWTSPTHQYRGHQMLDGHTAVRPVNIAQKKEKDLKIFGWELTSPNGKPLVTVSANAQDNAAWIDDLQKTCEALRGMPGGLRTPKLGVERLSIKV